MNKKEAWLEAYRSDKSQVWIKVYLSSGEYFFFTGVDLVDKWTEVKNIVETTGAVISEMSLQFRSHEVNIETSKHGMYLAKAAKGQFGGDTIEFIVTGRVKRGGLVSKQWWQVPELVVERSMLDPLEKCFEDMVINYEERTFGEE